MDCNLAATLKSLRRPIKVIGYGNSLGSDDGVGQQIAKKVAGWGIPNVDAITVHQLNPELLEALAMVDIAIFVAGYPTAAIQIRPLELAKTGITTGHGCEPQVLLAMTQAFSGYHPQAWWVMVPGVNFELGECLSPVLKPGIEAALQEIEHLIKTVSTEPCMKLGLCQVFSSPFKVIAPNNNGFIRNAERVFQLCFRAVLISFVGLNYMVLQKKIHPLCVVVY